jgi:hypothetical protein
MFCRLFGRLKDEIADPHSQSVVKGGKSFYKAVSSSIPNRTETYIILTQQASD